MQLELSNPISSFLDFEIASLGFNAAFWLHKFTLTILIIASKTKRDGNCVGEIDHWLLVNLDFVGQTLIIDSDHKTSKRDSYAPNICLYINELRMYKSHSSKLVLTQRLVKMQIWWLKKNIIFHKCTKPPCNLISSVSLNYLAITNSLMLITFFLLASTI